MKPLPLPSLDILNKFFELSSNSPTGIIWKERPREMFTSSIAYGFCKSKLFGKPAGSIKEDKGRCYFRVKILNKVPYVHRIVYSMSRQIELSVDDVIDHKDGNGLNNKIENLRLATSVKNSWNRAMRSNNTTGVKGICYRKDSGVYRGQIMLDGVRYNLGSSPSLEVMDEIIREFREEHQKEFANHGV